MVELVELVNSVFLSQMILLRWLTFQFKSLTETLVILLFWIYFFLLTLVFVLQQLSLHWKIVIMLLSQFPLTDFPINLKQDSLFHHIAYDYFNADQDSLSDHLRDVPWEDTSDLSNPYAHSILTLHLIKQIFDKNKSLRAAFKNQKQFWPRITPVVLLPLLIEITFSFISTE